MSSSTATGRSIRLASLVLLAFALPACGEDPSATGEGAEVLFIGERTTTDSIDAAYPDPYLVRIHGRDGKPLAGVEVHFVSLPVDSGGYLGVLLDKRVGWGGPVDRTADSTDAAGVAGFRLRLGSRPGKGAVLVLVPSLALQDTAFFSVTPGAPASVRVSPRDTAIYAGATYQLAVTVTDRSGATLASPVSYTVGAGAAVQGGRVSASAIGRVQIVATAGSATDTVRLSVVPRGRIAAARMDTNFLLGTLQAIQTIELDGSGERTITTEPRPNSGPWGPMWHPSGDRLVFSGSNLDGPYLVDTLGVRRKVLTGQQEDAAGIGLSWNAWPQFSRDGMWIYWPASPSIGCIAIWRARPDGTALSRMTNPASTNVKPDCEDHNHPSPSPDGNRVVFTSKGWGHSPATLRVLDVASGAIAILPISGYGPRWSPTGDAIAYIDFEDVPSVTGVLKVVRSDGTGVRTLYRGVATGLDWSPDGRWIVARGQDSLVLVNAESGMLLPLAFTGRLIQPTWRRD